MRPHVPHHLRPPCPVLRQGGESAGAREPVRQTAAGWRRRARSPCPLLRGGDNARSLRRLLRPGRLLAREQAYAVRPALCPGPSRDEKVGGAWLREVRPPPGLAGSACSAPPSPVRLPSRAKKKADASFFMLPCSVALLHQICQLLHDLAELGPLVLLVVNWLWRPKPQPPQQSCPADDAAASAPAQKPVASSRRGRRRGAAYPGQATPRR